MPDRRASVFQVGLLRDRLVLVGILVEVAVLLTLIFVPPVLAFPGIVLGLE